MGLMVSRIAAQEACTATTIGTFTVNQSSGQTQKVTGPIEAVRTLILNSGSSHWGFTVSEQRLETTIRRHFSLLGKRKQTKNKATKDTQQPYLSAQPLATCAHHGIGLLDAAQVYRIRTSCTNQSEVSVNCTIPHAGSRN